MNFEVRPDGVLVLAGAIVRCALGRGGVIAVGAKREGDGATPAGLWPLRRVLYRPDRGPPPDTRIACAPLSPSDGWCDDPSDAAYNQPVRLPYAARSEALWRDDGVYDVIVVLGYNDDPAVPGMGSAIFLHLARPDYSPTEGCVAVDDSDMRAFLALAKPGDALGIDAPNQGAG